MRRGRGLAAVIVAGEASTPPCRRLPAALACLSTSIERSTPGPLPYQMPNTPSTLAPGTDRPAGCPTPRSRRGPRSARAGNGCRARARCACALPQRVVVAAERRAAIARDEAAGVRALPRGRVRAAASAAAPAPECPKGRFARRVERVFVVEGDLHQRHLDSLPWSSWRTAPRAQAPAGRRVSEEDVPPMSISVAGCGPFGIAVVGGISWATFEGFLLALRARIPSTLFLRADGRRLVDHQQTVARR